MNIRESQINTSKSIMISSCLVSTLKKLNVVDRNWRGKVEKSNYLFRYTLMEIRDELKEITNEPITLNGINITEYIGS